MPDTPAVIHVPLILTRTSAITFPLQTITAKGRLALRTSHMETSLRLFNHVSAFRTVFPSRFLPYGLYNLSFRVFKAKTTRMLPRPTVSTGSRSTVTFSDVTMYILWRYKGTAVPTAAVERIGSFDFELELSVLCHEGCAKLF